MIAWSTDCFYFFSQTASCPREECLPRKSREKLQLTGRKKNSHGKQAGRKARQRKKGTVSTRTAAVTKSLLDRACNMHLLGVWGGGRTLNSAVYQFLWPFQLPAMTCCHFLSAAVRSALACHRRCATFHGSVPPRWEGPRLTSACPLPSSAASCPAAPPSGRAPPRRPSGPTGPASGPSLLASPRWAAGVGGCLGGRGQGCGVQEGHGHC